MEDVIRDMRRALAKLKYSIENRKHTCEPVRDVVVAGEWKTKDNRWRALWIWYDIGEAESLSGQLDELVYQGKWIC